jgi:hypothetical protein
MWGCWARGFARGNRGMVVPPYRITTHSALQWRQAWQSRGLHGGVNGTQAAEDGDAPAVDDGEEIADRVTGSIWR